MTNPPEDASLPTDREGLTAEIADIQEKVDACLFEIKSLMDAEDPAAGVDHAGAIHEAKQRHMVLRYRKELCQARLKRLDA